MEKIYKYNERTHFINEGLKAGLTQTEAQRQVDTLDELSEYKFRIYKENNNTYYEAWKNDVKVKLDDLNSYELGYWHQAFNSYMADNCEVVYHA